MEIQINENITIWQKYNFFELSILDTQPYYLYDSDLLSYRLLGINPTKIRIKDKWYDAIPPFYAARTKSKIDGYYRFIYIQINMNTGEYYIGKVNRKKLKDIKRYQGSGLRFVAEYKKHKDEFVRYFIVACDTAKQTEEIEASIVNEELLKDKYCLNLVVGGGGTNQHNDSETKRKKQSIYMKSHPESFQSMIEVNNKLYCQGDSLELQQRNKKIKETMSSEEYRNMTRERIKKWKKEHPKAYEIARENNRISARSEKTRQKKKEAHYKWAAEHPEEYVEIKKKSAEGNKTPEARKKHSESTRAWMEKNPEKAKENTKKRSEASVEVCRKPVHMTNLVTGEIIRTFSSQHEAAKWLVENSYAKTVKCVSSINSVCQKKKCTTGYGYRKKAYGFGWEYAENNNQLNNKYQ